MSSSSIDNYRSKIKDFYTTQDSLRKSFLSLSNTSFNAHQAENLKISLLDHKNSILQFKSSYLNSNFVHLLPEKEYRNRVSELEDLQKVCDSMQKQLTNFLNQKYSSNINPNDYQEKQFSNQYERLMYQRKKLEDQDEMINYMIGLNKENKQIGKEMGNNLETQNAHLEKVSKYIDQVSSKMNSTNQRFTNYLKKSSYCKLYIIVFVQALIILFLIIW